MKMKKVLAAVLAGTMVMASLSTAFAATSVDDLTCEGWWTNHTAGVALADGTTTTFTFTNTNQSTSNWNSAIYVVYTADEAYDGGDAGISATSGYSEYFVCRSDVYGWYAGGAYGTPSEDANTSEEHIEYLNSLTGIQFTIDSAPVDDDAWAEWLAKCQAGVESTLTATMSGSSLTVVFTVGDAQSTAVIPVDSSKTTYISLTGELCTLSNISYDVATSSSSDDNDADTDSDSDADTDSDTDTDTDTDSDSNSSSKDDTTTGTGDAAPIAATVVALLGCAAIVVASKKKMA